MEKRIYFKIVLLIIFIVNVQFAISQTTLSTGDVAFTGFNFSSTNDSFSVIFLTDITANTQVRFTDRPYSDLSGFLTVVGLLDADFVWEAPVGGVTFGTQVTFWNSSGTANASVGSIVSGNGLTLDINGDQIFAIQGSILSGTILTGIHCNNSGSVSATNWDNQGALSSLNESDLPNVLTNGVNALFFASAPGNGRYNCSYTKSTAAQVRLAINDSSNWSKNSSSAFNPTACVAVNSTWDGSNWSNGVPGINLNATIASSVAVGNVNCKDLTINNGIGFTLNVGDSVIVNGDLANNGDGFTGARGLLRFAKSGTATITGNAFGFSGVVQVATGTTLNLNDKLTLRSGTCLMAGLSTYGGGGNTSGNITVEKTIGSTSSGWRPFGLPVESTIDDFEGGLNTLCTNHSESGQRNVYYWDANVRGGSSNDVATGWVQAPATDDESKAYSIYLDSVSSLWAFDSTVSITGVPGNGTKTHTLRYTFDLGGDSTTLSQKGWNMYPNPYPSNIDLTDLTGSAAFEPIYKAIHVWDHSVKQFKAINSSSLTNYNTGGGSIFGTYAHIPPFMAFWVKADVDSQQIEITNAMRTCSSDSVVPNNYQKRGVDMFRLKVEDKEGNMDQVSVAFEPSATKGMDYNFDLFKFKSGDPAVPTLYTIADDNLLSLSVLPIESSYSLPIYMESHHQQKQYTISALAREYSNYYEVELEDKKEKKSIDIINSDYIFSHDKDYTENRFILHFNRKSNTSINEWELAENTYAYSNANGINIVYKSNAALCNAQLEIYTITGQKVYADAFTEKNQTKTFTPTTNTKQVYIIRVKSTNGIKTIKTIY